jgi:glutamate-ammonia-ligase adenylyltransferase
MVQYAVLRWASSYPDLLDWTDNIRLLGGLAKHEIFASDMVGALADAYRVFRSVSHRLALQEKPALVSQKELVQERKQVKGFWDTVMKQ